MTIEEARAHVRSRMDAFGREIRSMPADVELRDIGDGGPVLAGHAAVFDTEVVIGGWFRETINSGAFKKTIKEQDIRHLFNHDPNWVLARNKNGTLELEEDKVGLAFAAALNMADPQAESVRAKVERGDVDQSSFAFRVVKEQWTDPDDPDSGELPLRTIQEVQLFDTSSVTYPAYEQADTFLRGVGLDVLAEAMGLEDADERSTLLRALILEDEPLDADVLTRASEALATLAQTCRAGETPLDDTVIIRLPADDSTTAAGISHDHGTTRFVEVVVAAARAGEEPLEETEDSDDARTRLQLRTRFIARDKGLDIE